MENRNNKFSHSNAQGRENKISSCENRKREQIFRPVRVRGERAGKTEKERVKYEL